MLTRTCDRCGEEINSVYYYEFTLKGINAREESAKQYNSPKDLCYKCAKIIRNSFETFYE